MPLRLVLDTNIWLDWLVFDDAGIAPLKAAAAAARAEIFIDDACAAELAAVLGYPLRKEILDAAAQAACMAECKRVARSAGASADHRGPLPVCRDPDDQKFLALAAAALADALITKDTALLELARHRTKPPFRIVTPQQFASAVDQR